MTDEPFPGPALTALGLAASRAVESARPDRLAEDPYARALFLAAGRPLPMRLSWPACGETVSPAEALHLHGSRYIGLRTRFYDDLLTEAARDGVRQAVLLGAGLDTRAYRLALPQGLDLYELDQPGLLAWKRRILQELGAAPRCELHELGADAGGEWTREVIGAGFDPGRPALFLAEGLVAYLAPDEQVALLAAIDGLATPGSTLAFDRIAGDPHAGGRVERLSERSGIDMSGLLAAGEAPLGEVLSGHGWSVAEEPVDALAARYGRDLRNPLAGPEAEAAEPPWLETRFLTARREGAPATE